MLRTAILTLSLVLSTAFIAFPIACQAQQAGKIYRIGFLAGGAPPPDGKPPPALRQALSELGYVDGRNVTYEGRWAEAKRERLPKLASELVALKVDVIVTIGGPPPEAAKQATSSIPIVMVIAGDAVATGLVASLARPGGNVTGITDESILLSAKRMQLLKEAVPTAKRIAILWNADDRAMTLRYQEIQKAARALGVEVQPLGVREPDDFEVAFTAMNRQRPDALFLVADALTTLNRKRVFDYSAAQRIPAMYEFDSYVKDGGLMSYGSGINDSFRGAATYIDKIFKGAKPGDLPVQYPTLYYLVVNKKTAKALGLTIPQSILTRTDEIIE